ncbi:MAG TPA: 4Fe-4S dicluster domain-containing protein [Acidobacteriota bacterium]|nr:4Fe-4S dicluster domain-containing protein [Acidobacteriota bacterium]
MSPKQIQRKKAILLDTTRCVGCGACYQACQEQNGQLRPSGDFLNEDLGARTFTVVNNRSGRYVRRMCMHCEVPTCVSVCPVAALEKTAAGPVVYHDRKCIGCRYCMQACPFNVPRYEWTSTTPYVRKCNMCAARQAKGQATACATVCPTGATSFGDREEMIQEARRRILAAPDHYFDHIYGVQEIGGTSVLVISDVPPEQLGLPTRLGNEPLPELTWNVLEKIPTAVACGGVLLSGIWWITNRREEVARAEGKKKRS